MPLQNITTGVQTLTAPGAVAGTLDISGLPVGSDLTVLLSVNALSVASGAPPTANIQIQDSVDAFTTPIELASYAVTGPIVPAAPDAQSWRHYKIPTVRAGVASALLRIYVGTLTGTSPSISLIAQLAT